jgi:hypothetical protein
LLGQGFNSAGNFSCASGELALATGSGPPVPTPSCTLSWRCEDCYITSAAAGQVSFISQASPEEPIIASGWHWS